MVTGFNNNVSALRSQYYLNRYDKDLSKTISQISSGLDIIHPADDSAKFVTSEKLRTSISDINQAQKNTANAISMVQLAESGLDQINQLLVNMRRVAISSANDAVQDPYTKAANQSEIDNSIQELDTILANLRFGEKPLYKDESGAIAYASNDKIQVISASEKTKNSGIDGYAIKISNWPSYSTITARRELNDEELEIGNVKFDFITEQGAASYSTYPNETPQQIVQSLNTMFDQQNIKLHASLSDKNIITVQHLELGSKGSFQMAVSVDKFISDDPSQLVSAVLGADAEGTIAGEYFSGQGSYIYAQQGGRSQGIVAKLNLPYEIDSDSTFDSNGRLVNDWLVNDDWLLADEQDLPLEISRVYVNNRSLTFHAGSEAGELVKFNLPPINSSKLANNIINKSGFESLRDIRVDSFMNAQDSILLIKSAINEVTLLRGKIGSFQKNLLETNEQYLMQKSDQIVESESKIRDMDMAKAATNLAKQELQKGAATEALRSSNIQRSNVLRLFQR